ncbi:hypothetical protein [Mucilaginibacter sp. AK015]|uniref:hypothetical protein n=1 Tax=Mucilaginibacter sp. AK015 TaxID=2723072 RepID=UPI001619FEB7|nr:hypothetical protein [Mucilaginibacter sp. AK015]MBB5395637.1 hypothetical protein [Mucilaginibacter sp. AK015]
MSATYNWAYRPGVANKYGITIPAGADNVRPSGFAYVALFGNDTTGNGSRQLPYRTITTAYAACGNATYILGSGVYREGNITLTIGISIIGDGDVILDATLFSWFFRTNANGLAFVYNIKLRGSTALTSGFTTGTVFKDITVDKVYLLGPAGPTPAYNMQVGSNTLTSCVISNASFNVDGWKGIIRQFSNITLYKCDVTFLTDAVGANNYMYACIFSNCNIYFKYTPTFIDYSLFYQCNFKFGGITPTFDKTTFYPSLPTGYTYMSDIATIRAAAITAFGYNNQNFNNCVVANPLFNNPDIGDFTLGFASPAKNLSYFGTYVGARSIAYTIRARAIEAEGDFDFSSNTNINLEDDIITINNKLIDASIDTNCITNGIQRVLKSIPIFGFNADRNGQYIDSIADLGTMTKSPGDTLNVPASFIVEVGAIVYNSTTYQPGARLTTVAGQTTFATTASGLLREILEAPERHTVQLRFGNGGDLIPVGTAVTNGYWYLVESGSITYNSKEYISGQTFKAVDTNAFSGFGTVRLALSTEPFNHFEPGVQPTTNNIGDIATGLPLRGNGDPAYVRGGIGINEFYVNARFLQFRFNIRVSNLKP